MPKESTSVISKVDYDKRNDILYVLFENEKGNSYCEELTDGIEEMKDMDTGETTGFMVYYPLKMYERKQKELYNVGLDMDIEAVCK